MTPLLSGLVTAGQQQDQPVSVLQVDPGGRLVLELCKPLLIGRRLRDLDHLSTLVDVADGATDSRDPNVGVVAGTSFTAGTVGRLTYSPLMADGDLVAGEPRDLLIQGLAGLKIRQRPDGMASVSGEVSNPVVRALMRVEAQLLLDDADAMVPSYRSTERRRSGARTHSKTWSGRWCRQRRA